MTRNENLRSEIRGLFAVLAIIAVIVASVMTFGFAGLITVYLIATFTMLTLLVCIAGARS